MPLDPGPCQESSSRYYFNVKAGVCEEFMYGGCAGNENNFATIDECKRLCNPNGMDYKKKSSFTVKDYLSFYFVYRLSSILYP